MRLLVVLIIVLYNLSNCTTHTTYPPAMLQAENCMNTRPDSALTLLRGMESGITDYPEEVQMYWHLLTVQAKDKQYIIHTSDSLINRIVRFYEEYGDKEKLMMAYYYQGRVYRDMNDAPKALKGFQLAENVQASNWNLLTKVYSQMGYLFAYQGLHDEAIKVHRKSINIYKLQNKENQTAYQLRDIARMYSSKSQPDSAVHYYHNACKTALTRLSFISCCALSFLPFFLVFVLSTSIFAPEIRGAISFIVSLNSIVNVWTRFFCPFIIAIRIRIRWKSLKNGIPKISVSNICKFIYKGKRM